MSKTLQGHRIKLKRKKEKENKTTESPTVSKQILVSSTAHYVIVSHNNTLTTAIFQFFSA